MRQLPTHEKKMVVNETVKGFVSCKRGTCLISIDFFT